MRPGQQNKRGRGRNNNNNNNRKGGNPLSRTYDSSGPDVKIRGTAQHIAEKYANMARDAQGSSDNVMAENYFQHAEHYIRIIAAAQAQMQERQERENAERESANAQSGNDDRNDHDRSASDRSDNTMHSNGHDRSNGRERGNGRDSGSQNDQPNGHYRDDTVVSADDGHKAEQSSNAHVNGSGPQPVIEGMPAEVAMEENSESSTPRRRAASRPRRQPRKAEAGGTDDGGESKPARTPKPRARKNASSGAEENTGDAPVTAGSE